MTTPDNELMAVLGLGKLWEQAVETGVKLERQRATIARMEVQAQKHEQDYNRLNDKYEDRCDRANTQAKQIKALVALCGDDRGAQAQHLIRTIAAEDQAVRDKEIYDAHNFQH